MTIFGQSHCLHSFQCKNRFFSLMPDFIFHLVLIYKFASLTWLCHHSFQKYQLFAYFLMSDCSCSVMPVFKFFISKLSAFTYNTIYSFMFSPQPASAVFLCVMHFQFYILSLYALDLRDSVSSIRCSLHKHVYDILSTELSSAIFSFLLHFSQFVYFCTFAALFCVLFLICPLHIF